MGEGAHSHQVQTPGIQISLAQLTAQVRRPWVPTPRTSTPRGGIWLRDRVAAQTCTDACTRRPPLRGHSPPRQGKLRRSPHLTGKQQLPKREAARPERRLRLPQRRAPFSERKCLQAGQGSPDSARGRRTPAPGGCTRLSSASGCEDGKGRTLRGRPVGEGEAAADRPPPPPATRAARKPRRRARPEQLLRSPTPRPAPQPRRVRPRVERKRGKLRRCAAEYLPIHGPDGGGHGAGTDGLTASGGRRRRQLGGSGDGQAAPLRSPAGWEVEGEWETGAETRDAPATAAPPPSPPRKRVPASPHPAP